ncbi:MAG: hypothetical protein DWH96_04580 [Planctomycetota bacterium]|nr:MAG: hypothetical protein DWH96_04580 [Planctomycetota bacterium]RLS92801.1 MAG: hypothetical protein DWI11_08305 [Planctomycetota bacterium]RLT00699.1 MAG: hypothetical protein DWI20_00985 [Planctomycetota bacterium]
MTRATLIGSLVFSLASCALLVASGCNLVSAGSYILEGPGKIDAEYELRQVKTVVFVDDQKNVLPRTALRVIIGDDISARLLTEELVPSTISPRDAISISRSREQAGTKLSLEKLGKELGADQVIWVRPYIFDLDGYEDQQGARPTAKVHVKVIDITSRQRVYPPGDSFPEGRDLTISLLRDVNREELTTTTGRRKLEEALSTEIADDVAKLFYQHERLNLGEKVNSDR